ncbi:uncharacterized protein LOC111356890 [Spodoptera litura]|uniref:Uncharacterized protein LOC111356890 n=1 Tax=Spodoptera litura TaxID=69820 RepID=A0A9J7IW36_SPOLT|nr:uncharacterized protein LOC111356890 [Spodoptera litura]
MERFKKALILTKCCFCMDLKNGSLIILYYNLFSNSCNIVLYLMTLLAPGQGMIAKQEENDDSFSDAVIIIVIIISIVNVVVSIYGILGINRNIPRYVKIYLVYTLIYIAVIIFLVMLSVLTGHVDPAFIFWDIISILLYIYFYLVVRSYYLLMGAPSSPASK